LAKYPNDVNVSPCGCIHHLSLCDRKRQLNGFEYLNSMHFLAPAGRVVLTPSVALKIVTPEVCQNHLSCYGTVRPKLSRCAVKPNKQTLLGKINNLLLLPKCKRKQKIFYYCKIIKVQTWKPRKCAENWTKNCYIFIEWW
jgi:hypothetical protein